MPTHRKPRSHDETSTIRRAVSIPSSGIDAKGRTARVAFSSESPVRDFAGFPPVVLLHETGAADLERLQSVLLNHSPDRIIGRAVDAGIDRDRVGRATVVFDDDEVGRTAFGKVQSGSLAGASVGFKIGQQLDLDEDEEWVSPGGKLFVGPLTVGTRWQVIEFSLTPVPADASVGIGRSEDRNMTKKTAAAGDSAATDHDNATATASPAESFTRKERARIRKLQEIALSARVGEDELQRWIDEDVTVAQAGEIAVDSMIATAQRHRVSPGVIEIGEESKDKFMAAAGAGLLERLGFLRKDDPDFGRVEPFHAPLLEVLRETLRRGGHDHRGGPEQLLKRSHSTSDFPALLENVLGKAIAVSFNEAEVTYRRWCKITTGNRLRQDLSRITVSEGPDFEEVPELMPVPGGTISDSAEKFQIRTYGRTFQVSRAVIVNDDLGGLRDVPSALGGSSARKIDELALATLTANANMADGNALFSSAHANDASGAAMDADTVAELIKLIRKQVGINGAILDISPRYLLVPAALEATASRLLADFAPATLGEVVPPSVRNLELISTARLDSSSETSHFVLASPFTAPVTECCFLHGRQTPNIRRIEGGTTLDLTFVAWVDVGVGVVSHRGGARNVGA